MFSKSASLEHEKQIALMKFLSKSVRKLGISDHVYVVGGAVRNFVLKEPIKDIDIVVDPSETGKDSDWLASELDRLIPASTSFVTNQYGVAILTVKGTWLLDGIDLKGEVIEIANTRKESYGGEGGKGYKPSEILPATVAEDVMRREFSFNTLLWRMTDLAKGPDKAEIIDITGCGIKDLEEGNMQCPSDPNKTFSDDPTRMIRAIKFILKYGFKPTKDTADAIKRNAAKIRNVPHEAVAKLLVGDLFKESTYSKALRYMQMYGLLDHIKEMMLEHSEFATYMQRWIKQKPVQMLFDMLDMGIPLEKNLSFLSKKQQDSLRAQSAMMDRTRSVEVLEALQQPASVWKEKSFFMNLASSLGVEKSDYPAFSKKITEVARNIILEDINIIDNSEMFRRLVTEHIKGNLRMASTATDFDRAEVVIDSKSRDTLVRWVNDQVQVLPCYHGEYVLLERNPSEDFLSRFPLGDKCVVRIIGLVNLPDVQAVEVVVKGFPRRGKRTYLQVASTTGKQCFYDPVWEEYVIPISGPDLKGVFAMSENIKHFSKSASLLPVMSAWFNLREIAKQMILLEDHLFQTRKQCPDCIDKHLMAIEALSEEMVTLADADSSAREIGFSLAEVVRYVYKTLDNEKLSLDARFRAAAEILRKVRKEISKGTRPFRTMLSPVDVEESMHQTHGPRLATKSYSEKEDEATERLIRKAPKKKPPRHDSRKERVDVKDPDISRKDKDLSLNYKQTG